MIELVIKIPEEVYEMVMNTGTFGTYRFNTSKAIQHGTPLPKGHGDLKDMDDIYEALEGWNDDTDWIVDAIDCQASTIIEADTESEGEDGKDKER